MSNPDTSVWQAVPGHADAGELRLEDGVAESCVRACDTFLIQLRHLKDNSQWMSTKSAYGILESAQTLGAKFEQKALGKGGFRDVVDQHIEVVKQMRDLFEKAGKAYREADAAGAARLAAIEPR